MNDTSRKAPVAESKATEPPAAVEPPAPSVPGVIDYADFSKVELRTARIVAAEKIPGATKLLKVEVMIGSERRQLVAGIAMHYAPEDLLDKTVVVVTNLKPAVLRGVKSEGMLLAATKGESLRLVTVDGNLSSGVTVK